MSRELTREEARDRLLQHLWGIVDFWTSETRETNLRERISGAVYCVLSTLDGESGFMPKFIVAPDPHPEDKAYHQENGEDRWPETQEVAGDLAGSLHEFWNQADPRRSR